MAEAQRVNREMRSLNESGEANPVRFAALQASFEHAQQQYQAAGEERSSGWEELNSLQKTFMQAVFKELQLIGPAQAKLMAAMREEIGLTSDLDFLLKRIESTQIRMREAADKLLSELAPDVGPNNSAKPTPLHGTA